MAKISQLKEKFKKRYNHKARKTVQTKIDTSEQKKIKVDLNVSELQYDDCNALVLPSSKRHTKKLHEAEPIRILSKKHRKRLMKIKLTKEKKEMHSEVLKTLEDLHAKNKKLPLTSLQETQTQGRKKYKKEAFDDIETAKEVLSANKKLSGTLISLNLKKRKKLAAAEQNGKKQKIAHDPKVVRLRSEMTSSDDSSSDETSSDEDSHCQNGKETSNSSSEEETEVKIVESKDNNSLTVPAPSEPLPERTDVANVDFKSIEIIKPEDRLPSNYIRVKRPPELSEARMMLPIYSEEQTVVEAIKENMMTVIVGPTGSGKTTQVPQFLYEAGYTCNGKLIGVTEPRRVAAISMAERVGKELGLSSKEVSYQIRFEGNSTPETKIKFMTDGVLLKEQQRDRFLSKYSVIIIDEAHERSVFSDVMIGVLSRIVPLRHKRGDPLKLVVMSATLRVEDFTENVRLTKSLSTPPPLVKVDGRMYDVTIHYNKKTEEDYEAACYKKVCKIHRTLPEGAILVFLTGQQEVINLVRKLQQTFPQCQKAVGDTEEPALPTYRKIINDRKERRKKQKEDRKSRKEAEQESEEESENITKTLLEVDVNQFAAVAAGAAVPDNEPEEECDEAEEDKDFNQNTLLVSSESEQPLHVLPLYSLLPPHRQKLVFDPPPPGTRLCVVATNVAETSLTIPDVKYVVDCGKTKEKVFDNVTGVSMFMVTNCSQASANQRAGRAGRTSSGHCYRLYSSAVFNDFLKFSKPEILCRPIDDIALILKMMRAPVVNFPFPTPPEHAQLRQSLKRLTILGALEEKDKLSGVTTQEKIKARDDKPITIDTTVITELGRSMASYPVAPRYAKMLCLSGQYNLWPYTIALVSALTVQEVLVEMPLESTNEEFGEAKNEWRKTRLAWSGKGQKRLLGDLMVLLQAILEAEAHGNTQHFCDKHGLRHKGLSNIRKLRRQLTNEVNLIVPDAKVELVQNMKPPSDAQCNALRQIILSGSVDRIARRVDARNLKTPEEKLKWKHAYKTLDMDEPVYMPSSSVLKIDKPEWVVYQDIYETNKIFMRGVTAIEPEWLARMAPLLCTFSDPLESPPPFYDPIKSSVMCYRNATFGRPDWHLPICIMPHPKTKDLYCRFAYHILKGDVITDLGQFTELLKDIKFLLRPLALRLMKAREAITNALIKEGVTNKQQLLDQWKKNPTYLQEEYCLWLEDINNKEKILSVWASLVQNNC